MRIEPLRPCIIGRAALASAASEYAEMSCAMREVLARQAVEELALDRLARRVGDGVHEDVETVPALAQLLEAGRDLRVVGDVERQHDVAAVFGGRGFDARS